MGRRDDAYWAEFFGLRPEDWTRSGISFHDHVHLRGYQGLWCFRRGDRVVVSAPPAWIARLEALWAVWDQGRLMDAEAVAESLRDDCERCIGPAFHGCLAPSSFQEFASPSVRLVRASDRAMVERFKERCGDVDWSMSGLRDAGAITYACTEREAIIAMAGLRVKSDKVGDLCVLTDPRHRAEGRGAAVVGAVIRDALEDGYLVLYQTLESNRAAVRLASSLGFARYASHLAIRLRYETPGEARA